MADLNGKNVEEYVDNPQPSSCVHYDKNMEKVQRFIEVGLMNLINSNDSLR